MEVYGDKLGIVYRADHGQQFEYLYGDPVVGWIDPDDVENWCDYSDDEFEEEGYEVNAVWI